jgi:hypothetical protein
LENKNEKVMKFLNWLHSFLFGKKEEVNVVKAHDDILKGQAIVEVSDKVAETIAEVAVPVKKKLSRKKK